MYLFTSKRLGFRTWVSSDVETLVKLNQDKEVMKYFPSTQSKEKCVDFIDRMQKSFDENGFCYFATECLESGKLIGFIGLYTQTFKSDFTPAVDVGWRLFPEYWKQGLATEGAKACLHYGWKNLNLNKIISVAPTLNKPSLHVMNKIGMTKVKNFVHPLLNNYPELAPCQLFEITPK